jgi:hypothetical protein
LLDEIVEIFQFLEIKWPHDALRLIDDYLDAVLAANRAASDFSSLTSESTPATIDHAICRFVLHFLSFPVVDVGVAARRALARYAVSGGAGLIDLIAGNPVWDAVQLEHLLAAVQIGLLAGRDSPLQTLKSRILDLNRCESIAVRAIARRICVEQGWRWEEIRALPSPAAVLVPAKLTSDVDFEDAQALVGTDPEIGLQLHNGLLRILEDCGNNPEQLRSNYRRIYSAVESDYLWVDDARLALWRKLVLARFWLNPRALIGREAALRLFGRRALCGRAPDGPECYYDLMYPIYDPALELIRPAERPAELRAMEWDWHNKDGERWLLGENASDWSCYPSLVGQLYIIGERTLFIRPDWEWPREERYRGIIDGSQTTDLDRDIFASSHDLTHDLYSQGVGQTNDKIVVWNSERQLVGPVYRWIALNSTFARSLGWVQSPNRPFEWLDELGNLMVKSLFWRDGWIGLEPPRFEALGEGWLVLATDEGLRSIRRARPNAQYHLWVERHSHGKKPYTGSWHLVAPVSETNST